MCVNFLTVITVPEATKSIIERSRYLVEAMSKGLINYSSLARYIRPEIEKMLMKEVSEASIMMALRRFESTLKTPHFKNVFVVPPDMTIHSNLSVLVIPNNPELIEKRSEITKLSANDPRQFLTITQGITETMIILSNDLNPKAKEILGPVPLMEERTNLSTINIRIPKESIDTPGIVYFFIKSLAWSEINIIETVAIYTELTLLLNDRDVGKAFEILKSLFTKEI